MMTKRNDLPEDPAVYIVCEYITGQRKGASDLVDWDSDCNENTVIDMLYYVIKRLGYILYPIEKKKKKIYCIKDKDNNPIDSFSTFINLKLETPIAIIKVLSPEKMELEYPEFFTNE